MTDTASYKSAFHLGGQMALITGGASGIGRATAIAMAREGARVCIMDRNADAAQAVAEKINTLGESYEGKACSVVADVTQESEIESAIDFAIETMGGLNVLVNSAGVAIREATIDLSLENWQKVMDVNLNGVFLCARLAARKMLEAGKGGSIINVSSINGLSGGGIYPNISYQSSKGAVVNMTRAMAVEWAGDNIRVNSVAPTWVKTPFIAGITEKPEIVAEIKRLTPLGRLAEPDDIANAIIYLASPASSMVTGHILVVDGGFLAQ